MAALIHFLVTHNTLIIESIIGFIVLLTLGLTIKSYFFPSASAGSSGDVSASALQLGTLEQTLKDILAKNAAVPAQGLSADQMQDFEKLKAELEAKKEELATHVSKVEDMQKNASANVTDDEKKNFEKTVEELKSKLAEYEIISEDIADLSYYKKQNEELLKELDKLKGSSAAPVEPLSPAAALAAIMTEAVASVPAPEPVAAVVEAPAPVVAPPQVPAAAASAVESSDPVAAAIAAIEDSPVPSIEPNLQMSPVSVDSGAPGESDLPISIDTDKLISEAQQLQNDENEDKQLMSDFESFIQKKEGSGT